MIVIRAINFNLQETALLNQAAQLWDQQLNSALEIRLDVEKVVLGNNLLGFTVPNGWFSPSGGQNNCWYVSALADHLSGTDHQPTEPDGAIYIDSTVQWYTGGGNQVPQNEYDFLTNALHEMGHAFGYVALFSVDSNNNNGFYGRLTAQDLPNHIQLPFTFPTLNSWPSILGLRTTTQQGNVPLVTPGTPCPPQGIAQLGNDLVNPALFQVNPGTKAVYAPGAFQLFSSFDHIDPQTYPNALMQPSLPTGTARRAIDGDSWAVLANLGW